MERIALIALVLLPQWMLGQEFVINTGTDIRINPGCQVIFAQGGVHNAAGELSNAGELTVEGNIINDGVLSGGTASGTFKVLEDVENNGQMVPGQSLFELYGDDQYMRGSQPLNFYDLHLQGSGIKFMQQNITTGGTLQLNDRELRADVFTVYHTNPSPASVLYDFELGFVSAEANGGLSRATNSTQDYFYPLGSAVGTPRFRPANVRPVDAGDNAYKLRFANLVSPSYDQLSAELYYINYPYHHVVERLTGGSPADITIHYRPQDDGAFETLAHLEAASVLWRENPGTVAGGELATDYASFTTQGWNDFDNHEMALARWSTELFVPNVFSPNDDGENDVFIARGTNVRDFRMVIYDRWGNAVFESEDIMQGWDGTFRGSKMNSAVFVYYVLSGEEVVSKGNVTLLR